MHAKIFLFLLLCLAILTWGTLRADPEPPAIPAAIDIRVGMDSSLWFTAKGVQIYECRAVADEPGKYEWVFKAPEADLFDSQGRKGGRHYAGPTWELADGSKVVGKMKAKADAPDDKSIPWLLLEVTENSGAGKLQEIHSIQRINTVGGKSPAEVADASKLGQERRVDYTATYDFHTAKL